MTQVHARKPMTRNQKLVLWILLGAVVIFAAVVIGAAASAPTPQTGTPGAQMVAANRAYEVKQLEASIKKSAQDAVAKSILTGPILSVTCIPDGTGNAHSTSYACLAANVQNADGTQTGYNFTGIINWDSGRYQWKMGL